MSRPWPTYAKMSRLKIGRANTCGRHHRAVARFTVRREPRPKGRTVWPSRSQAQNITQQPSVSRMVPTITPVSWVRHGISHCHRLMGEAEASQPTENEPATSSSEPRVPTRMGQVFPPATLGSARRPPTPMWAGRPAVDPDGRGVVTLMRRGPSVLSGGARGRGAHESTTAAPSSLGP